jgi:hypothetical protein
MALPKVDTIVFDNVGWKSKVKIQPHRDCFHNSLDICITNMGRWTVACYMACEVRLVVLLLRKVSSSSGLCVLGYHMQPVLEFSHPICLNIMYSIFPPDTYQKIYCTLYMCKLIMLCVLVVAVTRNVIFYS